MSTVTLTSWTVESLRSLQYDAAQRAVIDVALAEIAKVAPQDYVRHDRSSKLVDGGQGIVFAIVGDAAHEVPRLAAAVDPTGRTADAIEYRPVVVDGQCLIETSERGRTKILVLMRKTRQDPSAAATQWFPMFMNSTPISAAEVEAAPHAAGARVARELPSGAFSFPSLKDLGLS